jgi:hypothetical protein
MLLSRRLWASAAVMAAVMLVSIPGVASAEPGRTQREISVYLAAHPDGKQISPNEVSFNGGSFVIVFNRPPGEGSGCPSGWFCFYDRLNFGGQLGKLSSCGWQDLGYYGWADRIQSVYNAQSYGTVTFLEHYGSYGHTSDAPLFSVNSSYRAMANVWPYGGRADHVNRHC